MYRKFYHPSLRGFVSLVLPLLFAFGFARNASAALPTSGVSTTPHIERAIFYATHGGKYSKAYIYVISRALCESFKVVEFVVNQIVPYPSIVEDDEVILVAGDFGPLPRELVVEVRKIGT